MVAGLGRRSIIVWVSKEIEMMEQHEENAMAGETMGDSKGV